MLLRLNRMVARPGRVVLLFLLVAAWAVFLRPASLGGPLSLVMVSGQSMEPTMETGDLAVVFDRDTYGVGDVVAFRPEGEVTGSSGGMVIHRIVDGDAGSGYLTQGDGNDWLDPWETSPAQVAGRMVFFVPGAGHVVSWLMDPVMLGALFAAATAFLVIIGSDSPTRRSEEKARTASTVGVAS